LIFFFDPLNGSLCFNHVLLLTAYSFLYGAYAARQKGGQKTKSETKSD